MAHDDDELIRAGLVDRHAPNLERRGDSPLPGNRRNAWAGQQLISGRTSLFFASGRSRQSATVVSTDDLGEPRPLYIDLRFAPADVNGSPTVWTPITEFSVTITIKRALDPIAGFASDVYRLDSNASTMRPQWLPVSTVQARRLEVVASLDEFPDGSQATWVECVVSDLSSAPPPEFVGPARGRANIFGAGFAITSNEAVNRADPGTLVCPQRVWQSGFLLHVPSTTVDPAAEPVLIRFGLPVSADRLTYSFALLPGQTYEAFPMYYWGPVYARAATGESGTVTLKTTRLHLVGVGGA